MSPSARRGPAAVSWGVALVLSGRLMDPSRPHHHRPLILRSRGLVCCFQMACGRSLLWFRLFSRVLAATVGGFSWSCSSVIEIFPSVCVFALLLLASHPLRTTNSDDGASPLHRHACGPCPCGRCTSPVTVFSCHSCRATAFEQTPYPLSVSHPPQLVPFASRMPRSRHLRLLPPWAVSASVRPIGPPAEQQCCPAAGRGSRLR